MALTGGPEGDTLIRRAARIADRSAGGDLLAVHVDPQRRPRRRVPRTPRWPGSGGWSRTSAAATTRSSATTSPPPWWSSPAPRTPPSSSSAPAAAAGWSASSPDAAPARRSSRSPGTSTSTWSRTNAPAAARCCRPAGAPCPTARLDRGPGGRLRAAGRAHLPARPGRARDRLNLTSEALLFLLTVVGVACIGGVVSAVIASVTASLLLNYWFIPPIGQFTLDDPNACSPWWSSRWWPPRWPPSSTAPCACPAARPGPPPRRRRCPRWPAPSCAAARRSRRCWNVPARPSAWTRRSWWTEPPDDRRQRHGRARGARRRSWSCGAAPCPSSERRVLAAFAAHVGAGRRAGPARRGRRRGRAGQGRRPDAYGAAAGRRPRPAHPARRGLGRRHLAAQPRRGVLRRRTARNSSPPPTSPWPG